MLFFYFRGSYFSWFFENFKIVFWIWILTFGGSVLYNLLILGFLNNFIHSSEIFFSFIFGH